MATANWNAATTRVTDSTNSTDSEDVNIQNTTSADSGLGRFLHRRNPRHHARQPSAGSIDRIFDTRKGSDPERPPLAQKESSFNEKDYSTNSYGITELRDNFFDAVFYPPEEVDLEDLLRQAEFTLPYAFRKKNPLSLTNFLPKQCHEIKSVFRRVTTTRSGIKLLKSFLAFFIAYILCLVPFVRGWLGRYSYVMVISTIINHPGRSIGAQVEGTIFTILGTATGLGWGTFALWLSTISATAQEGFGGILATFLCLYIFAIACIRSYYIRTYQAVISAGIAVIYTCLAEVSESEISWSKLFAYGVPWVLGQAIALIPCILVAPDAGARALAVALHNSFAVLLDGLIVSRPDNRHTRRRLAQTFVNLSQVYRDLVIDFSITLFDPKDVLQLRNLMQGVARTLISIQTETRLFDNFTLSDIKEDESNIDDVVIEIEEEKLDLEEMSPAARDLLQFVASNLAEPASGLIMAMKASLQSADATLMEMCGHQQYLGPPSNISNDVSGSLVKLRKRIIAFSAIQDSILNSKRLPLTYSEFPETVKVFTFAQKVHQASKSVEALMVAVNEMQQRRPKYPKFHPPSKPFWKSLYRTNQQVRHDRGGLTAGSYFRSFSDIAELIQRIKSKDFEPLPRDNNRHENHETGYATMTATELEDDESNTKKARVGHGIWSIMHRLQGFETRFALKTTAVTTLLSIPAWLTDSTSWWDDYEIWWAVVAAWLIMAPRVGGNIQDLFTRALCAVLGAIWGGLSYAADDGNPYVSAVFAVIFIIPMLYRFTQSTHPRSGLIGCISFTVVSLADSTAEGRPSPVIVAATRGGAIAVGVVASILVNWVLWPFVARHDLRKAISSMMFYCSIVYRSIVSKYVYYEEGHEPTKEDIEASEILEGRLREGFVRLRQLLGLTRHEIRMRAPFDPLPYSALIDACERFFEYLVTVRQSSLFYHPHFIRDNPEAAARLLGPRRDAIATVLTNLYVLSGALRADRKVPKYLPNAAAARKELLGQMKALERELEVGGRFSADEKSESMKWSQIYSYSYNESLTGCVEQLGELEKYTKAVVGEQGFDFGFGNTDS